jgi:Lar family restriction alleviation protein
MSVPHLRTCPFCGGPANLHEKPGQAGFDDYPPSYWIECSTCHTRGQVGWLSRTEEENTQLKKSIINKWNTRWQSPGAC